MFTEVSKCVINVTLVLKCSKPFNGSCYRNWIFIEHDLYWLKVWKGEKARDVTNVVQQKRRLYSSSTRKIFTILLTSQMYFKKITFSVCKAFFLPTIRPLFPFFSSLMVMNLALNLPVNWRRLRWEEGMWRGKMPFLNIPWINFLPSKESRIAIYSDSVLCARCVPGF